MSKNQYESQLDAPRSSLQSEPEPIVSHPVDRLAILREAAEVISVRQQSYGSPEDNFATIARLWSGAGFSFRDREVTASGVALAMILLKVARIANGTGSHDSFVDICGYAACGAEVADQLRFASTK